MKEKRVYELVQNTCNKFNNKTPPEKKGKKEKCALNFSLSSLLFNLFENETHTDVAPNVFASCNLNRKTVKQHQCGIWSEWKVYKIHFRVHISG